MQEIVLPVDIMLNVGSPRSFVSVDDFVSRLRNRLSTVIDGDQARASELQKTF